MKSFQAALKRLLRGPAGSRFLGRFGIDDPKRFWLLIDLFAELSEQGEIADQLGQNKLALKFSAWLYFLFSAAFSVIFLMSDSTPAGYSALFLMMTALMLLMVLISEAGNSLVNPVEALVLAHQPINGATYTSAKLTHLLRVVLYLVPALNVAPAVAGSFVKNAPKWFAAAHLAAAMAVGLLAGFLCCAAYGWLMRYVPVRRLKAASQLAAILPLLAMMAWGQANKLIARVRFPAWLARPEVAWSLGAAAALAAAAVVVFGLRSLSADYLIRVSGMIRGGAAPRAPSRRSRQGDLVARFLGGSAARAGFAYVARMMRRDYQFRRQVVPLLPALLIPIPLFAKGLGADPFTGKFSSMHVMPHLFGFLLLSVCSALAYGNDYKAIWIFQLAPRGAFRGVARGTFALLWINVILLPNAVQFGILAWFWGVWHAGLFTAYSTAAVSVYLGLELGLIDGVPFGNQMDPKRQAVMMPLAILCAVAIAVAVGIQHFLLFRSPAIVIAATTLLAAAAWALTRRSLSTFEAAMRYNLSQIAVESGRLYHEVD
ncbi:MAG: hypothetical protein LAQ30_17115 [Acidobacteriia bacterium]|nr:hypothetical protein [Terriglobia bacterium]